MSTSDLPDICIHMTAESECRYISKITSAHVTTYNYDAVAE